jgi:hypothetical protein
VVRNYHYLLHNNPEKFSSQVFKRPTGSSMNYQPLKIKTHTLKMLPPDYPQMQYNILEEHKGKVYPITGLVALKGR